MGTSEHSLDVMNLLRNVFEFHSNGFLQEVFLEDDLVARELPMDDNNHQISKIKKVVKTIILPKQ